MAETPVISIKDVRLAIKACANATQRRHEAENAEEARTAAMLAVFEPLLGVKSTAQVALMSREEIVKLASRRVKKGEVSLDGFELGQLFEVIQQSSCRRNVSWKDALIAELGEQKATELQKQARASYSYKFVSVESLGASAVAHAQAIGAYQPPAAGVTLKKQKRTPITGTVIEV